MNEWNEIQDRRVLIVALLPRVILSGDLIAPLDSFRIGHITFENTGLGDFTGFYDWLRGRSGGVIGVRYWPAEDNEQLFGAATSLPCVFVEAGRCIEVLFSRVEPVDSTQSNDQEFMYAAVFRSPNGDWALAFDLVDLTEDDLRHLKGSEVIWAAASRLS
jgi:hypothetical protein